MKCPFPASYLCCRFNLCRCLTTGRGLFSTPAVCRWASRYWLQLPKFFSFTLVVVAMSEACPLFLPCTPAPEILFISVFCSVPLLAVAQPAWSLENIRAVIVYGLFLCSVNRLKPNITERLGLLVSCKLVSVVNNSVFYNINGLFRVNNSVKNT